MHQNHTLIMLNGTVHVLMDSVVRAAVKFVVNAQIIVPVMVFVPIKNVLVILDLQEMIVHLLNPSMLVQITALEEDIVNKQIRHLEEHTNVSATLVSQDLIVQKQRFSVQEIVQVKVFVNVMELVLVKMDTLELLVNKSLKHVQVIDIVPEMVFVTTEHANVILDSLANSAH